MNSYMVIKQLLGIRGLTQTIQKGNRYLLGLVRKFVVSHEAVQHHGYKYFGSLIK